MPVTILLADDHTLVRAGLRRIIEECSDLRVVAEAKTGLEAVELAAHHQPDVAVLDIAMNELNGIEATKQILRRSPGTSVLILSMYADERYILQAVKAGARGYLLKDSVEPILIKAIVAVGKGMTYFSPAAGEILNQDAARRHRPPEVEDRYEVLSDRERQIYQMLAEGNSNKEIAARLGLSLHTVEAHRTHIMEKMNLHSLVELVLGAVRRGVVS